jgi:YHS domain-containing protein
MTVEDPVCRNMIALEDAAASEEYAGWTYFFCCSRCHRVFKSNPRHYGDPGLPQRGSPVIATPDPSSHKT